MLRFAFLFITILGVPFGTAALARAHQTMVAVQSYAFDTPAGQANGAAYVTIENRGAREAVLIGVSGTAAEVVEVHTHIQDGDLFRMVALDLPLTIAPGETLLMAPGGVHVMLLGLNAPLEVGGMIDLTLHFDGDHARDLDVQVEVFAADMLEELAGGSSSGHGPSGQVSHESMSHGDGDESMEAEMKDASDPGDAGHSDHTQ